MSVFTRDQFAVEGVDDAGVFMDGLGRALVTWAAMQGSRRLTVSDAALAFNTTPDVIREAVDGAMWIGYDGGGGDPTKQVLELDGE